MKNSITQFADASIAGLSTITGGGGKCKTTGSKNKKSGGSKNKKSGGSKGSCYSPCKAGW